MQLIWSKYHDCWWAANSSGYRATPLLAGVYTDERAAATDRSVSVEVFEQELEVLRAAAAVEDDILRRRDRAIEEGGG